MSIRLLAKESDLFHFLLFVSQQAGKDTVLRVAGGWVRDKLLNKESDDIDIALDNCHGREFALAAQAHYAHYVRLHADRARALGGKIGSAATIAANPSKSKHLETATVKMFGIEVDFVNLRAEDYAEGSRIPSSIRFGSPTQDALRRDLTINAMFYNINEGRVEDCTGSGLDDLRAGLIRTPLEPVTTFQDDPLRVLRAIRFATRFNYAFVPSIVDAGSLESVHVALRDKVSRERIGKELDGMFRPGTVPLRAMRTLRDWNLFGSVFSVGNVAWSPQTADFGCDLAERAVASAATVGVAETSPHLIMASVLAPWAEHREDETSRARGLVRAIVSDAVKWSSRDATLVQTIVDGALALRRAFVVADAAGYDPAVFTHVLTAATADEDTEAATRVRQARAQLGHAVRGCKEVWREALCVAVGLDDMLGAGAPFGWIVQSAASSPAVLQQRTGERLDQIVNKHQLADAAKIKPLLNGKVLMAVGVPKGPRLKEVIDYMMNKQLEFPAMGEEDAKKVVGKLQNGEE